MDQYVGLDVSLKETRISVRQNRKRIWRGKCLSHPQAVADAIRRHAPDAVLVVFETGSLSTWFYHDLTAAGLPAVCIDARHAKAALDTAPNKTDANDADGLSLLAEAGFFRAVRVKSWAAMQVRTLIGARAQLIGISTDLSNQIRGIVARGVACGTRSGDGTRPAARGGDAPEPGVPVVDDDPRDRRGHRAVVHDPDRGPGELHALARGGRLRRAHDARLPVG
jgi:transposase